MVFHGVAQISWPTLSERPFTAEFLKPQMGEKDWVFHPGPQKMAPKMKQTFEFQVK